MMVPQIKNTVVTLVVSLVGVPLFTVFQLNSVGEIHGFSGAWQIIQHTFFNTCMIAVGWIFFKSPFAGKLTEILQETNTSIPGGGVKQQTTSIKIQDPDPVVKPPDSK